LVATSFSGVVHSIAAATGQIRWATPFPGYQAHSSPALGRFKGGVFAGSLDDSVAAKAADGDVVATAAGVDVVVALHMGSFPHYTSGQVVWLDGASGRVLREYVVH
jgi:outer membrane protein assembly factor BamB